MGCRSGKARWRTHLNKVARQLFEEVAGADERGWCGDAMRLAGGAIQEARQSRVEIDLNNDWHG